MGNLLTGKRRKSNKKFMLLSAVGIIMVVDAHCRVSLNLFHDLMPYNSFFIPMFVFISGYFNKVDDKTDLWKLLKHKFCKLMIPYFVISFAAFWVGFFFDWIKRGSLPEITQRKLLSMFKMIYTTGDMVSIALPLWFVPALFVVYMGYSAIKKLLYKKWDSGRMLFVFTLINIFDVLLVKNIIISGKILMLTKFLFFLVFMELGAVYRDHLEKKLEKVNPFFIMLGLLLLNMIRILILGSPEIIAFPSLYGMSGFYSPCPATPLISSVIGILFWLELVQLAGDPVTENRVINYISENTFFIMGFHYVFFNIVNLILMAVNSFYPLPGFDSEYFLDSDWYIWENYKCFRLVYFAVGLVGSLILKHIYDLVKKKIQTKTSLKTE